MHHQFDLVDVHAAGGNVGGHQNPNVPVGERREIALAGGLRQVSVQINRRHTCLGELPGQFSSLMFGTQEQDSAPRARRQQLHQILLVLQSGDVEHMMGHRGRRRVEFIDGVRYRIPQETPNQFVDPVVQRRRKQQSLTGFGGGGQNAGDPGQEAEVGHVVGLIQHADAYRVQRDQPLLHQVLEASRAGHHDVGAGAQCSHLSVLRYPAEDGGHLQPTGRRQGFQRCGDLGGQFASRGQHQAARPGGTALLAG